MAAAKRSRIIAALFAALGGSFGLHKFYLRDVGGGIFYLFLYMMTSFLWFPVTAILGIFDALKLLSINDDQFDRMYNNIPQRSPYRRSRSNKQQEIEIIRERNAAQKVATPSRHNPYKKTAPKKYKEYDLEGAAADYKQALEINPNDKDALFDLACVSSLLEQKEDCLNALDKLISLGFKDLDKILNHDDLAYIRVQPQFQDFKSNGFRVVRKSKPKKSEEKDLLQDDLLLSQLNKLMELRKKGLLSDSEFNKEKSKLLSRQ